MVALNNRTYASSLSRCGFAFLARSRPSVGTEDHTREDGKPLWVLSTGLSSLSFLTWGRDGSKTAMGGKLGVSFEKKGRDEPGCQSEGEWYFSGGRRRERRGCRAKTVESIRKLIFPFVQKPEYRLHWSQSVKKDPCVLVVASNIMGGW